MLTDATRLRLLMLMRENGESCVGSLQKSLRLPQPTVSHHLGLMRRCRLISARRSGKKVFYSLANPINMQIVAALDAIWNLAMAARAAEVQS